MIIAQKFPKFRIFRRLRRIGCGCLIIFILLILFGLIFSGFIIRKLISGTITQQTGVVQTNLSNGQGQSFTDPKTGATINLGVNKVPDSFPKDFPIYPGSTVVTSQTGNGFWLTLATDDSVDTVSSYYENALKADGWNATLASGASGNTWAVSKGNLTGSLIIARESNKTSIIVVLGEVAK